MGTIPRSRYIPRLVPDPVESEDGFERFHHYDITTLRDRAVGAERHLLTHRLAWSEFRKRPDRILLVLEDGRAVGERDWMADRIAQLDAERRRRREHRELAADA